MLSLDSRMWQCYLIICAWKASYFQNSHFHSIKQPHCRMYPAPISSFGEVNSLLWQLGNYRLYFQMMIRVTQGDEMERHEARPYLGDQAVGTSEGIFWNMKCISPRTIIVPDILHSIHLGMLKHLMDWVTSFLQQHSRIHKFNDFFWARRFAVTRMISVDSVPVDLWRRSWKPSTSSSHYRNRGNRRVTPLRMVFLRLRSVVVLMKIKCRLG